MLNGLDYSAYQPSVNWRMVYAQAFQPKFGFFKFTEGNGWTNKYIKDQWDGAHELLTRADGHEHYCGPYHFCRWDSPGSVMVDALDEADHFYETVMYGTRTGYGIGDLPPVADLEWITGKSLAPDLLVEWIITFCKAVEQLFGVPPILYTGTSFWRYCLLPDKRDISFELTQYLLWIADYNSPAGKPKEMRDTQGKAAKGTWPWLFHQYSGTGRVAGVKDRHGAITTVDLNVFNGTMAELRALARAN